MRDVRHIHGRMTFAEYLDFEDRSEIRHEYVAGEVYAMSGETTRHNLLVLNVATALRPASRARGCRVFAEGIKVRVLDRVYYPDVLVACGSAADVELIVDEPSLVVEVLSPSTRSTDRREKLDAYTRMASLRMYVIIDQRRKHVLVYTRDASGEWLRDEPSVDGDLVVGFLGLRIPIAEIYDDVTLPPLRVNEEEDWDTEDWLDPEAR
jgi:Uma2 family endonuclease